MTDLAKQIDLITSKLSEQLETVEGEYQRWTNYKNDYDALEQQLRTLPDETKKSAMIPFGKLAFMPGTIIHTNEILVLLGDQYFAERSTKQALEILDRRREVVVENLRLVEAQLNSFKAKKDSVNPSLIPSDQVNEEGLPIMEIREELPPVKETPIEKKKLVEEVSTANTTELPESVVRARKLMEEADEKMKQNQHNDEDKALFDLLRQLEEEEEEEEGEFAQVDKSVVAEKPVKHVKFQDEEEEEKEDEEFDDFSDDEDERYDKDISENMFDRFADDEEYAMDGVVDQEDFTSYEEEKPDVEPPKKMDVKMRSPADIFNSVKGKDEYPQLDDEKEGSQFDLNELIQAARQISEPYYRPSDGSEKLIPMMQPTVADSDGILVANKTKLDNKIMKGAVMERETAPVDIEVVEEDMDLREITSSYHQKRHNMVAATGGFSFAPKPEFEVIEEELPLPKKKEEEPTERPKKMSRFKAARLGIQFEQE